MQNLTLGIDIGGTKVAGGLVTQKGRLVTDFVAPTRAAEGPRISFGQVKLVIKSLLSKMKKGDGLLGIGLCCPGAIDPETRRVISAPNLPGWERLPLGEDIEREFSLPVRLENDANAAGLAEALFGAGAGHRYVFFVTVSTGIGTGIVIDRKVYHGARGVAGEGGHVCVDYKSPYRCGCGSFGCIEALAAGPGMARRARVRLVQDHNAPSLLRKMTRGQLDLITPPMIQEAAGRGDQIARDILDETGFLLGTWLGGMINLLDPDAVVLGGGVSQIGKPLFDQIRRGVQEHTLNPSMAAQIPLLPAKLRRNAGIFGAASLFMPAGEAAEAASLPPVPSARSS